MICHKENIGGIYGHRRPKGAENNFCWGVGRRGFYFFGEYSPKRGFCFSPFYIYYEVKRRPNDAKNKKCKINSKNFTYDGLTVCSCKQRRKKSLNIIAKHVILVIFQKDYLNYIIIQNIVLLNLP